MKKNKVTMYFGGVITLKFEDKKEYEFHKKNIDFYPCEIDFDNKYKSIYLDGEGINLNIEDLKELRNHLKDLKLSWEYRKMKRKKYEII